MQIIWTGAEIAVAGDVDVAAGYYHFFQNSYNKTKCSTTSPPKCSGTQDALSFDVDWQFSAKADVYAGVMFSEANGGLASGYLHHNLIEPAVGVRFRFRDTGFRSGRVGPIGNRTVVLASRVGWGAGVHAVCEVLGGLRAGTIGQAESKVFQKLENCLAGIARANYTVRADRGNRSYAHER